VEVHFDLKQFVAPTLPLFGTLDLRVLAVSRTKPDLCLPVIPVPDLSPWFDIEAAVRAADGRIDPDEDDVAVADEFPIPAATTRATARALAITLVRLMRPTTDAVRDWVPVFEAAGDGGVGLRWERRRAKLLVVVSHDEARILFFGQSRSGSVLKGSIPRDEPVGFLADWYLAHELFDRRHPAFSDPVQIPPAK
jgi:hypothetical protein